MILGFVEDVFLSLDTFPPYYGLRGIGSVLIGAMDYSWLGLYIINEGGARLGDKTGDYETLNL